MGRTGHLLESEIRNIIHNKTVNNFIETGTYLGNSSSEASKVFDTVDTIEIVPELHEQAKVNCANLKNITFHLGDTLQLLPDIIRDVISRGSGCVWFLDAHQSGAETGNNGIRVPLLNEINIILDGIQQDQDHIFIIDDVRLFSAYWDWNEISLQSINECFKRRNIVIKNKSLINDRYIIYI